MVIDILPLGISDEAVLNYSVENAMVLITRDKADFGEMVFHQHRPFHGIVVLRTHTVPTDAEVYQPRRKTPAFRHGDIRRSPAGEKCLNSQAILTLVLFKKLPREAFETEGW